MSATATTLSPEDNRELLDAAAAAFDASRDDNQRGVTQAKRDVALALVHAQVLIATRDGHPFSEPGPGGGVLVAFTDDEAASAWARGRHPAAPVSELASSVELGLSGTDRKQWLALLEATGAASIALNPAGPLGSVVYSEELRMTRPRLLRRGSQPRTRGWTSAPARPSGPAPDTCSRRWRPPSPSTMKPRSPRFGPSWLR